ncbi:CYFA0S01e17106g1_1 [Cyberlindnera fabianii]|uniref:CYFA0S01e17106g1_1 n=1 Tax=Cyberlindnera fabianii TaxID=36022 RepID=A0A061AQY1_CYBFA|nr:hypothetical protein BON22_1623 [Cyberlindnera fabianii]CDR37783.1 CYFA0S01e17106g1_1 [Cyberlindnera fabianii]
MSWFSSQATPAKHTLTITAATSYNSTTHVIPVNTDTPITLTTPLADLSVQVRINGFVGSSQHQACPATSAYFDKRTGTNISIQIGFTPKQDIAGDELLFGNDFGYEIKDSLPYGTAAGLRLFKTYVDPSVDGDLYAKEPFLYGKALSSFNVVNSNIGSDTGNAVIEEDLSIDGELKIPSKSSERQKFFQQLENQKKFTFLAGHTYYFDFFSGLVSLKDGEFQISLPGGFEVNLSRYLNEKFNSVRYVLKKAKSGDEVTVENSEPLLVIEFQLEKALESNDARKEKTAESTAENAESKEETETAEQDELDVD